MKPGQIMRLGEHRLACGSAMNTKLVQDLVGDDKIAMVLTDVPYGVSYVESKQGITKLANQKVIAGDEITDDPTYEKFMVDWLSAVKPHLTPKNSVYIFNSDKMLIPSIQGLKASGGKFAQLLIWAKTHAVLGRLDYLPQHELIIYGWYGTHTFHKSKDKSIIVYPRPSKNKLHPTMKPVGLLRRLILNSSSVGDFVYDGFGGSGSCAIACEQTKRKCLMIELDSEYCMTIIDRWQKLTGLTAELEVNHENR